MPCLAGNEASLAEILEVIGGPLSEGELWAILLIAARALSVHADNNPASTLVVSPETVVLCADGQMRLVKGGDDTDTRFVPLENVDEMHDDVAMEMYALYSLGMVLFYAAEYQCEDNLVMCLSADLSKVLMDMCESSPELRPSYADLRDICSQHISIMASSKTIRSLVQAIVGTEIRKKSQPDYALTLPSVTMSVAPIVAFSRSQGNHLVPVSALSPVDGKVSRMNTRSLTDGRRARLYSDVTRKWTDDSYVNHTSGLPSSLHLPLRYHSDADLRRFLMPEQDHAKSVARFYSEQDSLNVQRRQSTDELSRRRSRAESVGTTSNRGSLYSSGMSMTHGSFYLDKDDIPCWLSESNTSLDSANSDVPAAKNDLSVSSPRSGRGPEFVRMAQDKSLSLVEVSLNFGDVRSKDLRKMMLVHVNGQRIALTVKVSMTLKDAFDQVVRYIGLKETIYFGLTQLQDGEHIFLDLEQKLVKYAPKAWRTKATNAKDFVLYFKIKLFVDDLDMLRQPLTSHLLFLQLRRDLVLGRLTCTKDQAVTLASLALQAEEGDWRDDLCHNDYDLSYYFPPKILDVSSPEDLQAAVNRLHRSFKGISKEKSELLFIHDCQLLQEYGLLLYRVAMSKKATDDQRVMLGLSVQSIKTFQETPSGLVLLRTQEWENTKQFSFRKKKFVVTAQSIQGNTEKMIFYTSHHRRSKYLLKMCQSFHRFRVFNQARSVHLQRQSVSSVLDGHGNDPPRHLSAESKPTPPPTGKAKLKKNPSGNAQVDRRENTAQSVSPGDKDTRSSNNDTVSGWVVSVQSSLAQSPPATASEATKDCSPTVEDDVMDRLQLSAWDNSNAARGTHPRTTYCAVHTHEEMVLPRVPSGRVHSSTLSQGFPSPSPRSFSEISSVHSGSNQSILSGSSGVYTANLRKKRGTFGIKLTGGADSHSPGGGLFVASLMPDSPADVSGVVCCGDQLVEVNGIVLDNLTHRQAVDVLRHSPLSTTLCFKKPPFPHADITEEGNTSAANQGDDRLQLPQPETLPHDKGDQDLVSAVANDDRIDEFIFLDHSLEKVNGRLGMSLFAAAGGGSFVREIADEPAVSDGFFLPGDQLVSINGRDVTGWSHGDVVASLQSAGVQVALRVKRKAFMDTENAPPMATSAWRPVVVFANCRGEFGVRMAREGECTVVSEVAANGPAGRQSTLSRGTVVRSINGRSTDGMTVDTVHRMVAESNPFLHLTVGSSRLLDKYSVPEDVHTRKQLLLNSISLHKRVDVLSRDSSTDSSSGETPRKESRNNSTDGIVVVHLKKDSGRLGFTLQENRQNDNETTVVIKDVLAGSSAQKSNSLFAGDRLIMINSVNVEGCSKPEMVALFQSIQSDVTLHVLRYSSLSSVLPQGMEVGKDAECAHLPTESSSEDGSSSNGLPSSRLTESMSSQPERRNGHILSTPPAAFSHQPYYHGNRETRYPVLSPIASGDCSLNSPELANDSSASAPAGGESVASAFSDDSLNTRNPTDDTATTLQETPTLRLGMLVNGFPHDPSQLRRQMSDLTARIDSTECTFELQKLKALKPKDSCGVGRRSFNEKKNRFKGLLPYDSSRVILNGGETDDYINATHVKLDINGSRKHYIAAQSPLSSTIDDFWRMLWENKVEMVVTLDTSQGKCPRYWPLASDTPLSIQDRFDVALVEENSGWFLTRRKFVMTNRKVETKLTITQLSAVDWPDASTPKDPLPLLCLVECVEREARRMPWVVHCSSGVSRTGLFLVMDAVWGALKEHQEVRLFELIAEVKRQQQGIVQTKEQYRSCHLATTLLMRKCVEAIESGTEHA